jgi:phosphatidylglycerophosphate synthase
MNLDKYQNLESYSDIYIFYPIADLLIPFLHDFLKLTPNMITTIGFIMRLIAAYMILCKKYEISAFLYICGYLFDSMDGRMARKYKESSLFGEAWDSVADTISTIIVIIALVISVKGKVKPTQVILLVVFIILMNIWSYTQESYAILKKTGNYNMFNYKTDKFKDLRGLIPWLYIHINKGTMNIDYIFNMMGGFEKWRKLLLSIMPLIGCGNLMILFCYIILSFQSL